LYTERIMMDQNVKELATKLLRTGYNDLPEREQRVLRRMAKRIVISENVNDQFHEKQWDGLLLTSTASEVPDCG
jgi:tartrate dehydratase alpha subunit/fumarate hydratase class I-like protein